MEEKQNELRRISGLILMELNSEDKNYVEIARLLFIIKEENLFVGDGFKNFSRFMIDFSNKNYKNFTKTPSGCRVSLLKMMAIYDFFIYKYKVDLNYLMNIGGYTKLYDLKKIISDYHIDEINDINNIVLVARDFGLDSTKILLERIIGRAEHSHSYLESRSYLFYGKKVSIRKCGICGYLDIVR